MLLKRSYGGARASSALHATSNTSSAFSDCQRVCCHSWLMLVPKDTNELWVRRGRQWIMSVKDPSKVTCAKEACQDAKDADWPVVFVESTEYTTSVSIVFEDEHVGLAAPSPLPMARFFTGACRFLRQVGNVQVGRSISPQGAMVHAPKTRPLRLRDDGRGRLPMFAMQGP